MINIMLNPIYCPVIALAEYLRYKPGVQCVLFVESLGQPLNRNRFVKCLKKALV